MPNALAEFRLGRGWVWVEGWVDDALGMVFGWGWVGWGWGGSGGIGWGGGGGSLERDRYCAAMGLGLACDSVRSDELLLGVSVCQCVSV